MRKGKINKKKYVRKRREYKIWCSNKRRRHEEEKEKEKKVEAIRTEEETWKYINKYRRRREKLVMYLLIHNLMDQRALETGPYIRDKADY